MSGTVKPSIDFSASGKFSGFLQIGDSTNTSGWAIFHIPIHSINSGSGPKVLVIGGNHGDEYEGQFAIANLIRELKVDDISGSLIAIPSVSIPASYASTRLWPDGTNFNRAFPGRENGSIPEKVAHFLTSELIPWADVVIDIHSGGRGMVFLPSATATWSDDPSYRKVLLENLDSWQTEFSLIFPSHPGTDESTLLPGYVATLKKSLFTGEFGGGAVTTASSNSATRAALASALVSVSLLKADWLKAKSEYHHQIGERKFIDLRGAGSYHWASDQGIYQNLKKLGDEVKAGELIGLIHYPESPAKKAEPIYANSSGVVAVIRGYPRVKTGDAVALIGPAYSKVSEIS
jgi:predicted deacylase